MLDEQMIEMIRSEFPLANLAKLWKFFLLFESHDEVDPEEFTYVKQKARFGFDIKFDIYAYINQRIKYTDDKRGKYCAFGGQYMMQQDLYTEIEKRSQLIKEFLMEYCYIKDNKQILKEDWRK